MKSTDNIPATVDEYLDRIVDPAKRILLQKVRKAIMEAAPGAEEGISYQMPAYKKDGILVYFAAFSNHCSLFPASKKVFDEYKKELAAFKTSKGTIQFTTDHPLPVTVIKKIVKTRLRENKEKMMLKKTARQKR